MPDDPGGVTWAQLTETLVASVQVPGWVRWSTAIDDADQGPDGSCGGRLVQLVADVSRALLGS